MADSRPDSTSPQTSSPTAPIIVRRLRPTDSLLDITELLHRAYAKQVSMGLHALASHQTPEITRKRVSKGECFVAELEGKVVGTIMFQEPSWGGSPESGPRWFRRPDVANFSQFAVDPSLQGRGIGLMLLDKVEQRAREERMGELALSTAEPDSALVRFYRNRGYRDIERFDWGVTNYLSLIMSKTIPQDA